MIQMTLSLTGAKTSSHDPAPARRIWKPASFSPSVQHAQPGQYYWFVGAACQDGRRHAKRAQRLPPIFDD